MYWEGGKNAVRLNETIVTILTVTLQLFVNNSFTELLESPTKGFVADNRLETDGKIDTYVDMVSTQDFDF